MKKRFLMVFLCCVLLCMSACGTASQEKTEPQTAADTSETQAIATDAQPVIESLTAIESNEIALTEAQTEASTEPETFVTATITVHFADDGMPAAGKYETCTAVESPQTRIVLSTNATVRDFKVLALTEADMDDDGEMHFKTEEIYKLDRLTADRPLLVSTTFYGEIPNNGISYVDETGTTRCFAVDMSGEDGSLYLWEFK